MNIKEGHSIREIQHVFHDLYPGLQIRFYSVPHQEQQGSMGEFEIDSATTLSNASKTFSEGDIDFGPEQTVGGLETEFSERFGLNVQIFRRSANLWLQTISTDDWTLHKQNRKGISSVEKTGGKLD